MRTPTLCGAMTGVDGHRGRNPEGLPIGAMFTAGLLGEEMNPHVKSVRALEDYELEVSFDNGESRRFDVKPYLDRGILARLRDHAAFRAVRVVAGSVEWANGLDLRYDTLYVEGQPIA